MRKLSCAILILISSFASALADVTLSGTQLLRSFEIESNELRERPTGRAGLTSYRFLTQVGGVNFELLAELPDELVDDLQRIEYDPAQPDGSRLRLYTQDTTYIVPLYDWILIPTIHYADSPFSAVVSLLGGETDLRNFHARYHPSLEDTLVGLRMLQADFLPIDLSLAMDLPRVDGKLLLGPGESESSRETAPVAAASIQLALLFAQPSPSSWVLTDVAAQDSVPVAVQDGQLVPQPSIYYSFWMCEDQERCEATDTVTVLHDLNAEMRGAPWKEVNTPVWNAAEQLAGYSAIFRSLAAESPEVWETFYRSVPLDVPPVQTPNLIPRGAFQ